MQNAEVVDCSSCAVKLLSNCVLSDKVPRYALPSETEEHHVHEFRDSFVEIMCLQIYVPQVNRYVYTLYRPKLVVDRGLPL